MDVTKGNNRNKVYTTYTCTWRLMGIVIMICVILQIMPAYHILQSSPMSKIHTPTAMKSNQPHVVYFLADDLGWNDVGYHGSFIKTPTIDQLAVEGVKLERFYMNPTCTQSRAAVLSGRYVTHTGLQHLHIVPYQPNGLSLNCTLLPEALRQYSYKNYMVGKWHLGFYKREYTPERRGFDKFFGIYPGAADHFTRRELDFGKYTLIENRQPFWENKTYDTHLYVQKATEYVDEHLKEYPNRPMFLFVSFQAVHQPLQVPEYYSNRYCNITADVDNQTCIMAGMTTAMDEGIKNITYVFKRHGIWENTVMFFSTDNGGFTEMGSSNKPLSEGKGSLFEGGIRGVAFVRGKGVRPGRVSRSLMHITDIYPTILAIAGLNSGSKILSSSVRDYLETLDGYF